MEPNKDPNISSIKLDFRFVEIEHEVWALGAYLENLGQQLELLIEKENERFKEESQGLDEEDWDMASHEHWEFVEMVVPRFVLNPALVGMWALYESAIIELAKHVTEARNAGSKIQKAPGNNTLDKARNYYEQKLKIPLCTDAATFERLEMLLTLRNAIAHANGRVDALRDDIRDKIKAWERNKTGVVIQDGEWVSVSMEFIATTYAMMKTSLEDLIGRVRVMRDGECRKLGRCLLP